MSLDANGESVICVRIAEHKLRTRLWRLTWVQTPVVKQASRAGGAGSDDVLEPLSQHSRAGGAGSDDVLEPQSHIVHALF